MRITFRQGIVRHQTDGAVNPVFLNKVGQSINLLVSPDFTIVSFIDGTKDYLFTESATINNAWTNIPIGVDSWIYWDLHKITGVRTFGITTLAPITQSAAPTTPSTGQMWFKTTHNNWMEFNGASWVPKLRVFAAKVTGGSVLTSMSANTPLFTGTQVGITSTTNVGSLAFDSVGNPIINQDGKFFTTEDVFTTGVPTGASLKVNNILVRAIAQEPIAPYQVVQFTGYNKINLANPFDAVTSVYGIVEEDVPTNDVANVITDGVIFNADWNWDLDGAAINDPIYIDATGQLVLTADIPNQVPVAAVIGKQTILFQMGIYGYGGSGGSATDHGALLGLSADDHLQYHTDARGDIRYAPIAHDHVEADITDLDKYTQTQVNDALDLKIDLTEKGAASGIAPLGADSKIPDTYLPLLSITDTSVVADEITMLALTAQTGDVAVRTDLSQTFILRGTDATVLADWEMLLTPTDAVLSVSGKTGVVTLNLTDLSDVTNATPVDKHVLIYDGITNNVYENRLLVEADISDFGTYLTAETSHTDVLVDGDFATAGLMKTDGAGVYSIDTNTYLTAETSHADVLVDGDFATAGLMKTDGAGVYSIDANVYLTGITALSIGALSDVDITTVAPTNGQALAWNSTSTLWEPLTISGGGSSNNWVVGNGGEDFTTAPTADGAKSFAAGYGASAGGTFSLSVGYNTVASAANSQSFGYNAAATGIDSIAIGNASANEASAISIGKDSLADGIDSLAIGTSSASVALATGAIAIGNYSNAGKSLSISIGNRVLNGAPTSIAIGNWATVVPTNESSNEIALGNYASTNGLNSLSIGNHVTCVGTSNIVIGDTSTGGTALANHSIAIGYRSTSSESNQIVIGKRLDSAYVGGDAPVNSPNAVIIGNGQGGTDTNIIHLHDGGKLDLIGTKAMFVAPTYTLATLPAVVAGGMIYVSDATGSGARVGSQCFGDGVSWIDVTTGIAVV